MRNQTCAKCRKLFQQNDADDLTQMASALGRDPDHPLCYKCALAWVTRGMCPEEGDFNAASIISGEMSDFEMENLQRDLEAVERGQSIIEPLDGDDDYDDPAWCDRCNRDTAFCLCVCHNCGEYVTECDCDDPDIMTK